MKKRLCSLLVMTALLALTVCPQTASAGLGKGSEPFGAVIKETITLDGEIGDSGWLSDGWTEVSEQNGMFQDKGEYGCGANFRYQMRTDDTRLYVAVVTCDEPAEGGNAAGTNLRLWIRTDTGYKAYTHFYDIFFEKGAVAVSGKRNTSKTDNVAEPIPGTSIQAALKVKGGKTQVEFSILLSEFGGQTKFPYYICSSNKSADNPSKYCLYYPAPTESTTSDWIANFPYKTWDASREAKAVCAELRLGEREIDPAQYAKEIAAKMGEPNKVPVFAVEMKPSVSSDGKTVTMTLQFSGLTGQIAGFVFDFGFDTDRLTLQNRIDDSEKSVIFDKSGFASCWENLTHVRDDGIIEFSLIDAEDPGKVMKPGNAYSATFTFAFRDGFTEAGFWIPHDSVDAVLSDYQFAKGNGSMTIASTTPHVAGNPVKEKEVKATCTQDGSYDTVVYCKDCGLEMSRKTTVVKALGHDYKDTVVPPTATEKGYTLHKCSRCGDEYKDTYVDPIGPGPEYEKGDVNGDSDVTIQDYLMVKAHVLGTKEFDAEIVARMDVNEDGEINIADYLLVKKIVLEK